TEGLIFSDDTLMQTLAHDAALTQVANVACLPGIVGRSLAMPDCHYGYGFPIGGVAAFDMDEGVISPGGVGYDINCGVRLLRSNLTERDVRPHLERLATRLFQDIPSGVGGKGKVRLGEAELRRVLERGAGWAVARGYGSERDLEVTEERGCLEGADPDALSDRALARGRPQLGTLGSGNHFIEIQRVDRLYDPAAAALGLEEEGQVVVMIHTGSRGLGYQVCDDSLRPMQRAAEKYGIELPDRQLACAPVGSREGERYFAAMACAANYGWCNRQIITHWVREAFEQALGASTSAVGLEMVYDVAHNVAKFEEHQLNGRTRRLCVHRKGATRAFGPGRPELPECYRRLGQPVIVPGDMGTASYLLLGTETAMERTFGSTAHGAGRVLSRKQALKLQQSAEVAVRLGERGVVVRSAGRKTLAEEAPEAYKDVDRVVGVCAGAGLSKLVARMTPMAVVKG
ncbi:MAG: RtcB family protein, partial [Armatimonadetes bacterium]|nr:RtcB family protein [Armatimonadota bacterium]